MMTLLYAAILVGSVDICFTVKVTLENRASGSVPIYKEIRIGTPGSLPCFYSATKYDGSANVDVQWSSGTDSKVWSNLVFYEDKIWPAYSERFSFIPQATIQISSAEKKDRGYYKCEVTMPDDQPQIASGVYNLTITVPPSVPICKFPSDRALTIGQRAELKCHSFEGIPTPRYVWLKDDQILPLDAKDDPRFEGTSYSYDSQTGVLTFSKVKEADAGSYSCQATNKLDQATCASVTLRTKTRDVGAIVGIVFGCIFGLILVAVLIWWLWRRGYCAGIFGSDDDMDLDADEGNDVMLDGNGPTVHKPPSLYSGSVGKHEASMMV